MAPGMNLTGLVREKRKNRLDTWRKTWFGCTGLFAGELSALRSKRVYYIRLSRETGLFYMDIQGGQVYGVQLDQGDRLSWFRRNSLWVINILREKAMVDIFCTAININTPEEDSSIAFWVSLPRGRRLCYFPLRWWSSCSDCVSGSTAHIQSGLHSGLALPPTETVVYISTTFFFR